jgi:hypothetical protein
MLEINIEDVTVNYNLGFDDFQSYTNLVATNYFIDGEYEPVKSREAMYFGFLMYCTDLDIDFQENYYEVRTHSGLLSLYQHALFENPRFFEEVRKYAEKDADHTLYKVLHKLEDDITELVAGLQTVVTTINEKIQSIDFKKATETLNQLEKSGFNAETFVGEYIKQTKEQNDNTVIEAKNEKISELSKYKTLYDARNVLADK